MTLRTRDAAKLNTTTWHCQVFLNDGDDIYAQYGESAEYPNLGLAVAWMNRTLPTRWRPDADPNHRWWGRIERGTYVDRSFYDDGYGHVQDACWEPDERPGSERLAFLAANNVDIDWSEA